ncbi:hypothetical protein [Nocardia sp. NBC_01377]|uniref:hypothetical protein n=1 Tax=Nocardia sp. NBC_01377 TaxID=2903595 RepID=UPI00386EC429
MSRPLAPERIGMVDSQDNAPAFYAGRPISRKTCYTAMRNIRFGTPPAAPVSTRAARDERRVTIGTTG